MGSLLTNNKKLLAYILDVQEEELKRISRELHEEIAQTIYSVLMGLQMLSQQLEQAAMQEYAKSLMSSLERTLQEIRWVSTEIYPPVLDPLSFAAALQSYLKVYTATFGIVVDLDSHGVEKRLPRSVETALFRICQEALYNVAKHADTDKVQVTMTWLDQQIEINIKDNGKGFDVREVSEKGQLFGIASMKQRTELLGGDFEIQSAIGKGTTIRVCVHNAEGGNS